MGTFLTKEQELEDIIKRLEKQVEILSASIKPETSEGALPISEVGETLQSNCCGRCDGINDFCPRDYE